jgi:phi13 family phage major tail protein
MGNKVVFGLENVHIAFKGTSQTESIEITNECATDGEITVAVTAATLLGAGSPASVIVPLAAETHDTESKVASAAVNALNNDETISAVFRASRSGSTIVLTTKVAQANDASLAIAFTVGGTGVTVGPSTNGANGTVSWGAPTAVPGAVSFKPTAEGEESTFYADNGPYFVVTSNNGYKADLTMALVPTAILAEMLGWPIDDNGMLLEISNGPAKKFALLGQVEGDEKARRFVYYDCTASRPEKEEKTKEKSITPNPDVLKLNIVPIEIGDYDCVKGTLELSDTNTAVYNAFFNSVLTPVFA